jgi:hypothetical protein
MPDAMQRSRNKGDDATSNLLRHVLTETTSTELRANRISSTFSRIEPFTAAGGALARTYRSVEYRLARPDHSLGSLFLLAGYLSVLGLFRIA